MMKLNKSYLIFAVAAGLTLLIASCTNLTETPYSSVTANNFFKTDQQFASALGAAYTNLAGYASGSINNENEWGTDEEVVPQRGSDWYDGGVYIRAHHHQWDVKDPQLNGTWTFLYGGVSTCNRLISQFSDLVTQGSVSKTKADAYISELKVLRAFYYYWALDMFGNVPIVTKFKGASSSPSQPSSNFQTGRDDVYKFVMSEIYDNMGNLSTNVDASTYGRMTAWGAHFLLAKLYLNHAVYDGTYTFTTADMDSVIANCNAIINSGKFSMAANYFDNFKANNQTSPEFIFAIPYDHVNLPGFNIVAQTLHYLSQETFNLTFQPWNGYASLEDFYNSFQSNDVRKTGFLHGFQKSSTGAYLIDKAAFPTEPYGDTLYFTAHINELDPSTWREAGVRFDKFRIQNGQNSNMDNDFPVFRYTDVILMKAEAEWRNNNGSADALNLVNKVRERAGLSDYATLDAYKILLERGHEFYTEGWRRQDLIRFKGGMHYHYDSLDVKGAQYPYNGAERAYNDAWWEHSVDPNMHVNVLPIPFDQLNANSNLVQNPGY